MKVALITGGQPRFTPCFPILMEQLNGFDTADIYMTLWKSDWAYDESVARSKIEKILRPNYNLSKICLLDEPDWRQVLPPHHVDLAPPIPETITWWFKRIYLQFISLSKTFEMIDHQYDCYIRFRLDGLLDKNLNLNSIPKSNDIIFPSNSFCGFKDFLLNDQFAVGNYEAMKFYFNFGNQLTQLIPAVDPNWVNNGKDRADNWQWSPEHLMAVYMKNHNKNRVLGNFQYFINTHGRSKFTDKHYHHSIAPDPTA